MTGGRIAAQGGTKCWPVEIRLKQVEKRLEIDFDDTVVWNGTPVKDIGQLESYFHTEADKPVQAEIHLRPDRRVKYDSVAKVLAAAQRNRMKKIGFVNTSEFKD